MTQPTWIPDLTNHIETIAAREQIPGLAIAVAKDGQTLYEAGIGCRDVERQLPATPGTVFGIASVTKSFAALGIMQLADEGRLSVHDPVVGWLPEFRLKGTNAHEQITIHHFLSHTSGLPGMRALFHARAGSIRHDPNVKRLGTAIDPFTVEPIRTAAELMAIMADADVELLGAPGTHFNYSNEGYALLGEILVRASGKPFRAYMHEHILDPLGMARSTFVADDFARFPEVTELYAPEVADGKKTVFHAPVWWDCGEIYANGSLKSTVQDLIRYLEVYRCGGKAGSVRIASEAAIRQMTAPHVTLPTGRQYGYGLDVQPDYQGVTLVGHGGGLKGVSSHVKVALQAGVTAVTLTNLTGVSAEAITMAGVNAAMGLPLEAQRYSFPQYNATPAELERLVGLYQSEEGGGARAFLEDGVLKIRTLGQTFTTRSYATDGVVMGEGEAPVRFLRREGGEVWGLFTGVRVFRKVSE